MLGFALGEMGMRLDDFDRLTPVEFNEASKAYNRRREEDYREQWERARHMAATIVQPWCKKGLKLRDVMRFPWDQEERRPKRQPMSKDEQRARMEALASMIRTEKHSRDGERPKNQDKPIH